MTTPEWKGEEMETTDMGTRIEKIAAMAHEVNRLYCQRINDYSQMVWQNAPNWQRESVFQGVIFLLTNLDADAAACHESWMRHKVAEGWRYGKEKNVVDKTHPALVPFNELSNQEQIKDKLFVAVVRALS